MDRLCLSVCVFCFMACGSGDEGGQNSIRTKQQSVSDPPKEMASEPSREASSMIHSPTWVAFECDGYWGYRDLDGTVVMAPRFEMAYDFKNGKIAFVFHQGNWACIDRDGKILHQVMAFDNGPDPFVGGLSRMVDAGKIGFFNAEGLVVISPEFDFAFPFAEGLAVACVGCDQVPQGEHAIVEGGKWGYIDAHSDWVIPAIFDSAHGFENGEASAVLEGKSIRIDIHGNHLPQ